MHRGLRVVTSILVMIACITVSSFPVFAQDETTPDPPANDVVLGLFPDGGQDGDRFEFTIEPGQSDEMTAILTSFGTEPVRLRSYPSHILAVPNGGMQIPEFGAEPEGTVSWIDFPTEELVLSPGEPIEKIIRVTVPEGTPPGQYVNAIALETLDPVLAEGSPFAQYFRKVVSVYVTVPGDVVVEFSLGEPKVLVNQGRSAVQMSIDNSGNTRIDLEGTVTLMDGSGAVIHEGTALLGPIYMDQSTIMQVPLPNVPAAGDDYSVSYTLSDKNSSQTVDADQVMVTVPEDQAALAEAPARFTNLVVEANADPIVFANVSVDIEVTQSAFRSTRLTLEVFHDGEFVEDFVLADNLSLPLGTTPVSQRYLPATNWESGTYTFSLKLESTSSDQTTLVLEEEDVATLEVP